MPFEQNSERTKLEVLLATKSVFTGHFKLSSGAESSVYVDGKLTTCSPEAMPLVGHVFLNKIAERGWRPDAVGGLTVGADPIAFAIARESIAFGRAISAFIVRKQPKEHGRGRFIEGVDNPTGLRVVIIDDVCSHGTSTGQAIEKAKNAGMIVLGAICLVDREMGARGLLEGQHGCRFDSIFTLTELLNFKNESQLVAEPVGANVQH